MILPQITLAKKPLIRYICSMPRYNNHAALIASYLEAYKLANPHNEAPNVFADKGFIRIGTDARYTAAQIDKMRSTLLQRAAKIVRE